MDVPVSDDDDRHARSYGDPAGGVRRRSADKLVRSGEALSRDQLGPLIEHRDAKVEGLANLGQLLADMPGADDQEMTALPVDLQEHFCVSPAEHAERARLVTRGAGVRPGEPRHPRRRRPAAAACIP